MTATNELREGLRKRGESWHKWPDEDSTTWQAYSNPHTATESMDGTLIVTGLTPEQAVIATLGTGTCHMEQTCHVKVAGVDYYDDDYVCSECGAEMFEGYNFCPNCGAKVVTA